MSRLKFLAPLMLGLTLVLGACAPTTGGGTTTTTTSTVPSTYTEGRCPTSSGVTVVVDFMPFQDRVVVRCALGPQASGLAALGAVELTTDPGPNPGTVCQLDGLPVQGFPFCWTTGGYWSYWRAPSAGQSWVFSEFGVGSGPLTQGSVEGWRFALFGAGPEQPPRVGTSGPIVP